MLEFPGAELGRRGWTGKKRNMENHLAGGVAVLLRGPLLYPAPHGAQPQPRVGSVKTLCQHTEPGELAVCVWAKEKAELAALGFPWPGDPGSWDI